MARGIIRKPSFAKVVGAYRSQWKRFWMRLFTLGLYGKKGTGWWSNPKKALYNFWYHRTSVSVYELLGWKPTRGACFFAMICASVIGVFAAPVDATKAGVQAHKIRKAHQKRTGSTVHHSASTNAARNPSANASRTSTTTKSSMTSSGTVKPSHSYSASSAAQKTGTPAKKNADPKKDTVNKFVFTEPQTGKPTNPPERKFDSFAQTPHLECKAIDPKPIAAEETKVPDENAPKSMPKSEGDQYIRKRMIIAGSSDCDQAVVSSLCVGTYFDLQAEPTNPHDKNAVALLFDGKKIGYVAKADIFPFVSCLKLNRSIYGVITDIKTSDGNTQFEYETWFYSEK